MTAEDELEQLSGSGHSNMLALRRTEWKEDRQLDDEHY